MKLITPDRVAELSEKLEELADGVAASMIQKCSLEPDIRFNVGPIKMAAVLPTQEMTEAAAIDAYRDPSGQPLDLATREPRMQRFLLAKTIKRIEDEVEFEDTDEDELTKRMILARLPQVFVEQIWFAFMAQRNALMLVLNANGGERVKKSSASPPGEHDGGSSVPKEESPSPETDSQSSTPPK